MCFTNETEAHFLPDPDFLQTAMIYFTLLNPNTSVRCQSGHQTHCFLHRQSAEKSSAHVCSQALPLSDCRNLRSHLPSLCLSLLICEMGEWLYIPQRVVVRSKLVNTCKVLWVLPGIIGAQKYELFVFNLESGIILNTSSMEPTGHVLWEKSNHSFDSWFPHGLFGG